MTESAQFRIRSETDDDLDLVHAGKNGDVAALEQLVKRYDRNFSESPKASHITGKIPKTRFRKPS